MPLLDKSLVELETYLGINPKPDDFDAYWDSALRELDTLDPQVELVPNRTIPTRQTECFDLWFTGIGGARVYAKYLRPTHRSRPAPALLNFHGYGSSSGSWVSYLPYLSEGFCVAALDCRGQGGLSVDNSQILGNTQSGHIVRGLGDPDPKKLLFRQIFLDTALLARIVMGFEEVDETRVGAMGASQGGGLTVACAALEPRICRMAPVNPFLSDYLRVWQMDLCKDAYAELRTYLRLFDPLHEKTEETFLRLGYIDVHHLAPRIKAKTLFAMSQMDTICPPSTQFAVYNKITAPKERMLFPDFGHEELPLHRDRNLAFMLEMSQ